MKESQPLPKCQLPSLLCSYEAVRSHLVSQETSISSNTITLLVLLNSHFRLQAHRCFVTVRSLELSLQRVIYVMHFAGKGLKYLVLCQTSQYLLWLYGFTAKTPWFCHCHTVVL